MALVAPWMWRAIQAGLDRLYYRDRYDYRRALLSFTRDLNSDLDLTRLSQRLVDRIAETLGIDRIALFLPVPGAEGGQFAAYAFGGLSKDGARPIVSASTLAARLMDGQTVVIDDPLAGRRLTQRRDRRLARCRLLQLRAVRVQRSDDRRHRRRPPRRMASRSAART